MHIVCPHCRTSYAVHAATFGDAGRTVRCSKCKETWLAHPEELASVEAPAPAMETAESGNDSDLSGWGDLGPDEDEQGQDTPTVDSPSISADWSADEVSQDGGSQDDSGTEGVAARGPLSWLPRRLKPSFRPRFVPGIGPRISLSTVCAAMAALVLALLIWRVDVVRLMPQTASFYRMVGLEVNLRGLAFKDVNLKTETVDGKPVLVVEGVIIDETRKPVELPRLRFIVRDAQGTEIYAWNAKLEQPLLQPGDKAWFRSRLASPPPEGRSIDVRFFNKRDMAAGSS